MVFYFPEFSLTKHLWWKFHVAESTEGRYNIIIGRGIINTIVIDIKFSDNIIFCGKVPFQIFVATMLNRNDYDF